MSIGQEDWGRNHSWRCKLTCSLSDVIRDLSPDPALCCKGGASTVRSRSRATPTPGATTSAPPRAALSASTSSAAATRTTSSSSRTRAATRTRRHWRWAHGGLSAGRVVSWRFVLDVFRLTGREAVISFSFFKFFVFSQQRPTPAKRTANPNPQRRLSALAGSLRHRQPCEPHRHGKLPPPTEAGLPTEWLRTTALRARRN